MSIDLIPPPGSLPLATSDYQKQNALIQQLLFQYNLKTLFLTQWETLAKPTIKQGISIHHGGSQFIVNTEDYIPSGSPSDGRVYLKLTRVGDQLQASFVNSAAGFLWNYAYNGFYSGNDQLLPYIFILENDNYHKYTLDRSQNKYDIEAKIKIDFKLSIGIWNMDTTTSVSVLLPIQFRTIYNPMDIYDISDYINSTKVHIVNDAQDLVYDIRGFGSDVDGFYAFRLIQEDIQLSRVAGASFDGIAFDDDTINRGHVHLECLL